MAWSSDLSDDDIVQQMRDDPQRGFTLLLERYGGRIHGFLRQRFPMLDDAALHDAIVDAMLLLVDSFDARRGPLSAWFLLLAHQQVAGALRCRKPGVTVRAAGDQLPDLEDHDDPLARLQSLERLSELQRAIGSLPPLERAVLEADLAEGRPVVARELADRLGTSIAAVYTARRRARAKVFARCDWIRSWLPNGKPNHETP